MNNARCWETPDELMTISVCTEGCVHLRVGRAIIKLVPEEFFALAKLTETAAREIRNPDYSLMSMPRSMTGH
jgi:hypothetical protein